jgi:penicillin amidase
MQPGVGLNEVLTARTVDDVHRSLGSATMLILNFVFADTQGNIAWRVGGKLPVRADGDGILPRVVTSDSGDWVGWIPFEDMPHETNPRRGWLGTCNHKTVTDDFPHYFSNYFAPSYRYRRLIQLLGTPGRKTVDDHWQFQRDIKNLMAQAISPIMAAALLAHDETQELGRILADWDFTDDPDSPAPTVFQTIYRKFAEMVFEDELGPKLTATMLANWYFWQERLQLMVTRGNSAWFDVVITRGQTETRDQLFHQTALEAARELRQQIGGPPSDWLWGKVHQIEFVNPLRREGSGKSLVGGQTHPMGGSGETLYRGWYDFDNPAWVTHSASLRMVIDLSDPDKVAAVLPGGVAGRTFHRHFNDQVSPFMNGEKLFWWFSDAAIAEHAASTLVLRPGVRRH